MERLTIREAVIKTAKTLDFSGCEEARTEARLLVAHAAQISEKNLLQNGDRTLGEGEAAALDALMTERLMGTPIQYVLGRWAFMGLPFITDTRALIPRQDTETLCEEAIALIRARGYRTCLDMCSGSGCIGISLAKLTGISAALADCDEGALALSRENAALNETAVTLVQSDLFASVRGSFDLIVCNPPYLSDDDMVFLQRELAFEPRHALYGGTDGLDFYRRLAKKAMAFLNPGGALLMEVGVHQAAAIAAFFEKTAIACDLNGIERVVTAFK